MRLLRRIQYLLRQRREARELAEEIAHHRAMVEAEEHAPDRSSVQRRMGNSTRATEDARGVWLPAWLESAIQDLRYAARSLARQPAFTCMSLLALVLGIGLNTSLFSSINTVMFRPWNVAAADRVVKVFVNGRGFPMVFSRPLAANAKTISGAIFYLPFRVTLGAGEASANAVSGNYFDVLHVKMLAGRGFTPEEDFGGTPTAVAVLSHTAWSTRYGGDKTIVGRQIQIDDVTFTVIGVAPENFPGTVSTRTDVWIPPASWSTVRPNDLTVPEMLNDPKWCCAEVAARLAPGVQQERARAEIEAVYAQFAAASEIGPRTPQDRHWRDIAFAGTAHLDHPGRSQRALPTFALLLAAIGSVLLLACANVGNLLLARATARQREIAVRIAIGAGRARIVRQLLTESLLLAAIASLAGLAIAYVLPRAMVRVLDGEVALGSLRWTPDWNVAGYSVAMAMVSTLLFGLAPALQATRRSVSESMKRQGTHSSPGSRLRGFLMGVQVAISVTLLAGASLLVQGLLAAQKMDVGFRTQGLTGLQLRLPVNSYDGAKTKLFVDTIRRRLREQGTAAYSLLPPLNGNFRDEFQPLGRLQIAGLVTNRQTVSPEYLDLLEIPVVRGRAFTEQDTGDSAILISETLASQYWPLESPIGQTVKLEQGTPQIVGVVRDSQLSGLGANLPAFFLPYVNGKRQANPS